MKGRIKGSIDVDWYNFEDPNEDGFELESGRAAYGEMHTLEMFSLTIWDSQTGLLPEGIHFIFKNWDIIYLPASVTQRLE